MNFLKWIILALVIFTTAHYISVKPNYDNSICKITRFKFVEDELLKNVIPNHSAIPVFDGHGTGTVIAETKNTYIILTAGHLIEDEVKTDDKFLFTVEFPKLRLTTQAQVLYSKFFYDKPKIMDDVAILEIDKIPDLKAIPLDIIKSTHVITVGFPSNETLTSLVEADVVAWNKNFFQLGFQPAGGRSGSPVLTKNGILGIVLLKSGHCINSERILEILTKNYGEVVKNPKQPYNTWTYIFIAQIGLRKEIV